MVRFYASEDGVTGYKAGDLLVNITTHQIAVAIADGHGVSLRPATGGDLVDDPGEAGYEPGATASGAFAAYWYALFAHLGLGRAAPLLVVRDFGLHNGVLDGAADLGAWLDAVEIAAHVRATHQPAPPPGEDRGGRARESTDPVD